MSLSRPPEPWKPISGNDVKCFVGRAISWWSYPLVGLYVPLTRAETTVDNAKWFRTYFALVGLGGSILGHLFCTRRWGANQLSGWRHIFSQAITSLSWDLPHICMVGICHVMMQVLQVNRNENRLHAGRLHGPRVLVVGNGPSALDGAARGTDIDEFDEVVRFNNFQCKVGGLEDRVGTKTTVHFSDGVLYPTFSEYHAPGADVILSLFCDRFIVTASYFILRGGADIRPGLTRRFMMHPDTSWITKDNIERVKKLVGLSAVKHPTSGMLAIDHFVNMPGVQLPVVIHGFDFFQGPTIHYFHKHEPLYERINNRIGVNMHSPHLEKIYVEKLISEGKVRFLQDTPKI